MLDFKKSVCLRAISLLIIQAFCLAQIQYVYAGNLPKYAAAAEKETLSPHLSLSQETLQTAYAMIVAKTSVGSAVASRNYPASHNYPQLGRTAGYNFEKYGLGSLAAMFVFIAAINPAMANDTDKLDNLSSLMFNFLLLSFFLEVGLPLLFFGSAAAMVFLLLKWHFKENPQDLVRLKNKLSVISKRISLISLAAVPFLAVPSEKNVSAQDVNIEQADIAKLDSMLGVLIGMPETNQTARQAVARNIMGKYSVKAVASVVGKIKSGERNADRALDDLVSQAGLRTSEVARFLASALEENIGQVIKGDLKCFLVCENIIKALGLIGDAETMKVFNGLLRNDKLPGRLRDAINEALAEVEGRIAPSKRSELDKTMDVSTAAVLAVTAAGVLGRIKSADTTGAGLPLVLQAI